MDRLQEFLKDELEALNKSIVATPASREALESFAKSNGGSMDMLLMQMAIQFGYKIAIENIQEAEAQWSSY